MSVSLRMGRTPNYATVTVGTIALHFSYETVIGFSDRYSTVVSENIWGPTTGKHINALDGGSPAARRSRLPRARFEERLNDALEAHGLR